MSLNIGIVTTSIREGRVAPEVAKWTLEAAKAQKLEGVNFEIVDLKNYNLPFMGAGNATPEQLSAVGAWAEKIASFDGFIFVTAEYNHAVTGVFKNALDFLTKELNNKAVAFVGYGGLGGIRAIENLRVIMAEAEAATVQKTINFTLANDFENYSVFKPLPHHISMFPALSEQLIKFATALKTIR